MTAAHAAWDAMRARQFRTPTPALDPAPPTAPLHAVAAVSPALAWHLDELRTELAAHRRALAELAAGAGLLAARLDAALAATEVPAS